MSSKADNPKKALNPNRGMVVPAWWASAFDTVAGLAEQAGAMEQSLSSCLLPALSTNELNALAMILGELQPKILEDDPTSETFQIIPHEFTKHVNASSRERTNSFVRVLQIMPALRILSQHEQGLHSLPLFKEEGWRWDGEKSEEMRLEVSLTPCGEELVLGHSSSAEEMLRRARGESLLAPMLGSAGPLSLWRSAWMELQGIEQLLLLRLEQAMQWECCWVHFDGIFGKRLVDLVAGLEIKVPKRIEENFRTQIAQAGWLLDKVGKKLCHQGLLRFDVDDEYLALNEDQDRGLLVLWQVTAQKNFDERLLEYEKACIRRAHSRFRKKSYGDLRGGCGLPAVQEPSAIELGRLWDDLKPIGMTGVKASDRSFPILSLPLFLEWSGRLQPGHPFPLPEALQQTSLGRLMVGSADSAKERYEKFLHVLDEGDSYSEAFTEMPLATLTSAAAWKVPGVSDFLREVASVGRPASFDYSSNRIHTSADLSPEKETPKALESQAPSVTKSPVLQLRKMAAEELKQMKLGQPSEYQALRDHYLSSLDESRRKLILDVKSRMTPDHFDGHLRHSLIKFMVENPSLWKGRKPAAGMQPALFM